MSDRFKFRVWDDNRMRDDFYITPDGKLCDFYRVDDQLESNDFEAILMQCTGLKDKNGFLIYEGDILKLSNGNICVIEYSDNDYGFISYIEVIKDYMSLPFFKGYSNFEIIGNKFENPELLEAE